MSVVLVLVYKPRLMRVRGIVSPQLGNQNSYNVNQEDQIQLDHDQVSLCSEMISSCRRL